MKVVIDLPDKIYNRYINYTESYIDFMFIGTEEILVKAIRNGTPLPKHGRLIDADEYLRKICTYKDTGCGSCNFQCECIADEPTIIESDEESD